MGQFNPNLPACPLHSPVVTYRIVPFYSAYKVWYCGRPMTDANNEPHIFYSIEAAMSFIKGYAAALKEPYILEDYAKTIS